jgi:hypothetical protein
MHAFVHKKMTKYLCTIKNTRYYVVKKPQEDGMVLSFLLFIILY